MTVRLRGLSCSAVQVIAYLILVGTSVSVIPPHWHGEGSFLGGLQVKFGLLHTDGIITAKRFHYHL